MHPLIYGHFNILKSRIGSPVLPVTAQSSLDNETLVDFFLWDCVSPPVDFKIGHYISSVAHCVSLSRHHTEAERFSGECGLIMLNSLNTHWLHLPEVPELEMPPYFRHTAVVLMRGFHCTCTYATVLFALYLHASVFSISIPSTHTRSTECCDFWSLLTPHQETLQELMRRRRVPVLPLQTAMSLRRWVRTSVSPPSGLSDCVSHDPHKDQVAGSRETTALVRRPFNISLHVRLVWW